MQAQAKGQYKSIFEGTNIKVRQIELSPKTTRALKANSEYSRTHGQITEEEIRELPPGVIVYPPYRGIYRTVSGANHLDHVQLVYYPQPVLGGSSTAEFLKRIKEGAIDKDHPIYKYKDYVSGNYWDMCSYFPYAAQVAYDLYTDGKLSERSHELKKIFDERYSAIIRSIEE